jgi:hypothetical protein
MKVHPRFYPNAATISPVITEMFKFEETLTIMQKCMTKNTRSQDNPPVEEPPNEPQKPPVKEPGEPAEPPQPPGRPPVKEPPNEPAEPPVREPPPEDPDRVPPQKPPMKLQTDAQEILAINK